ncbi:hypothetical protein HYH03_008372 [Edaphochlamys debaryana]|uniref:Pherophorin domain-containing protein n=1 Tax=Edaphochlamys debaryana TaxID=47281 RepID=A0A836BZM3_9CHLO|nr:hypothetical protein HYH03_008372 [Edaphochlamys debaryana]|eukprot:KAG2493558.1 hypothetical protein HYH03_008372 [Edaphochlamys debaryana]
MARASPATAVVTLLLALSYMATLASGIKFPYAACNDPAEWVSPIQVERPARVVTLKDGYQKICWTFTYDNTDCKVWYTRFPHFDRPECCTSMLTHKFEMDLDAKCAKDADNYFRGRATLQLAGQTPQPASDPETRFPPSSDGVTQATLAVSKIFLDKTNVSGAVLCVTLEKGACKTLRDLVPGNQKTDDEANREWAAVLWDDKHSSCYGAVPAEAQCSVDVQCNDIRMCFNFYRKLPTLQYTALFNGSSSDAKCVAAKSVINGTDAGGNEYKGETLGGALNNHTKAVFGYADTCPLASEFELQYVISPAPGTSPQDVFWNATDRCPSANATTECTPTGGCNTVNMCFTFIAHGECNTTEAVMPFAVKSAYVLKVGSTSRTYCFPVEVVYAVTPESRCGRQTTMDKVSFGFKHEKRWQIKDVYVRYPQTPDKKDVKHPQVWSAPDDNNFKVTDLENWTVVDLLAYPREICFRIDKDTTLLDLVPSPRRGVPPTRVQVGIYNYAKDCCPVS